MIRNAQDATPASGAVSIELQGAPTEARLTVVDNGSGMDEEFQRHRLFRPFDSTKGAKGMGIGPTRCASTRGIRRRRRGVECSRSGHAFLH